MDYSKEKAGGWEERRRQHEKSEHREDEMICLRAALLVFQSAWISTTTDSTVLQNDKGFDRKCLTNVLRCLNLFSQKTSLLYATAAQDLPQAESNQAGA